VGVGGITIALAVFLFLLVESLVGQWDERREALARTEQALTAARSELTATHAHLSAAYENLRQAQARVLQGYVATFVQAIREYAAIPGMPSDGDRVRRRRVDGLLKDAPDLLRICKEGAERVRTIVERLRGLARSEAGERTAVDVVAAIESALRFVDDRLRRRGIAVCRDYQAVPAVEADGAQLSQVWINLLTNAADALEGRPTPEIAIAVRHRAPGIEVEIRDNGPGMDPETMRRIFEPFFTTKPTGRGTGLGLSIAESTVRRHGGEIAFESDAEHGTCAIVRLPAAR
jgi:signal transduction histidine kinase